MVENNKPVQPPKSADRFFKWYCCEELSETILGDLHEDFHDQYHRRGPFQSKCYYWLHVIRFINRHTLARDKNSYIHSNHVAMFYNYLLITFRNLWRNKGYTAINTVGLAIGMASCMIIFFYVQQEMSVDQFHKKHDRIYRLTNTFERSSGSIHWARTPPALAPAIRNNISGIEKTTRLRYADDHTFSVGERIFTQNNVFYADSVFLQIFDFTLKVGDPNTALSKPNTIVITEEMAIKYFGKDDPMGKVMMFDQNQSLEVTGILESLPSNTHITFDMLISFESFKTPEGYLADLNSWAWAGFHTYALLSPHAELENINEQVVKLYREHLKRGNIKIFTELQPLLSIYLTSHKYTNVGESIRKGNYTTIYGLAVVAILILIMAGFNFMNLSTALSLGRGKEVGIRKTMGAAKSKIVTQFLLESQVMSFISLLIAFVLIFFTQEAIERHLGINLPSGSAYTNMVPIVVLATFLLGIMAGLYPSVVLSNFNPIVALRGHLKTGNRGVMIRNGLVVFQFIISIMLLAGSLVVVSQINFVRNKELGFDKENILQIKMLRDDMTRHFGALKNAYEQHPQVVNVSMTSHSFDGGSASSPAYFAGAPEDEAFQLAYYQADNDFLALTGIELKSGRFFSEDFISDSSALILNETAVALMELKDPIGAKFNFVNAERSVIGVVKDFHFNSLHSDIAPMAIVLPFTSTELMLVKVTPGDISGILTLLEDEWRSIVGDSPFDVTFLDDRLLQMYAQEQKLAGLINLFSVLAVLLACLGLYGLVAFSVQSKLKEIGVRKVLGANLPELFLVLTRRFIILIMLANLIAWPLVYYFGDIWLNNFAYRIDLSWWIYVGSGAALLLIAILTISHQTIIAAHTNPVNVLRSE